MGYQKLHFSAWISICWLLLYSLGIFSKIHSVMERKINEKNATVFLANYDRNEPHFYFFVLSLQLNNSKDLLTLRLLGVERVWCFRVLFADTHSFFTLFENKLTHLHTAILHFTKWLGFTLNSITLRFFLSHSLFLS